MSSLQTSPKKTAADESSDQSKPGKEKPPRDVRDLAIAELRYQTALYLEAVQAMMDGVTLGAEQVQDKRIDALEAGPTVDAGVVILTVALTLILEGTVAPAIAAIAVRTVLRPVMRMTARAMREQERRVVGSLLSDLRLYKDRAGVARSALASPQMSGLPLASFRSVRNYADACENAAAALRNDLRGRIGGAASVRTTLNAVIKFTEANLVAGAKATSAASLMLLRGPTDTPSPDLSPGVSITAAAMASSSRMRLTIVATHESLEAKLGHPDTTLSDIANILSDYRLEGEFDLEHIRSSFQTATEAMIWAALLLDNIDKDVMRHRRTSLAKTSPQYDFIYSQEEHKPRKVRGTKELRKYLVLRFADEVRRFARESNAWTGSLRGGFQRPQFGPNQSETEKDDLLVAYLASVADGTPPNELRIQ